MSTYSAKPSDIKRNWFVIDAEDKTLGRMATEIAKILRGKHKPEYTPHIDTGDYVVVINSDKVKVTGNKLADKIYYKHTGYIGNLKSINLEKLLAKDSTLVISKAVKGMLPRNPLGRAMFKKLKIYVNSEHKHQAQNPQELKIG